MSDKANAPTFKVERGQTYIPCRNWNWQPLRPFVVEQVHGADVYVWDPVGGYKKRGSYRWVKRSSLHETNTTKAGKERQTGYHLHAGPPTEGQVLCGSCMTWVDSDRLAVNAGRCGHSQCHSCSGRIDEAVGIQKPFEEEATP